MKKLSNFRNKLISPFKGLGRFFVLSKKKKIARLITLLLIVISLPVGVYLVQRVVTYMTGAQVASARFFFEPSQTSLPPTTNMRLIIDSGASRVAFVRAEINFDPSVVSLSGEIDPTDRLATVVELTSASEANSTGRATIVLGLATGDKGNPPSGVFELARFPVSVNTSRQNVSTQISLDSSAMQLGDLDEKNVLFSVSSATLTLNSYTPTSTSTPTPRIGSFTPTPSPRYTSTPTPRLTSTPTPSPKPTSTPKPSVTSRPTSTSTPTSRPTTTSAPLPTSGIAGGGVSWLPGIELRPKSGNWSYPDMFVITNVGSSNIDVRFEINYWSDAEALGYIDKTWTQVLQPRAVVEVGGGLICGKWSLNLRVGENQRGVVSEVSSDCGRSSPTPTTVVTPTPVPSQCSWWDRLWGRCGITPTPTPTLTPTPTARITPTPAYSPQPYCTWWMRIFGLCS